MKKIHIIEDNEKNMKLFLAILKLLPDVQIITETEGDKGLETIKNDISNLIILDIQLPKMSGIEICRELRAIEKFKKVPIIAVTSFAMKGDKERILAAGFNEYIAKPINVSQFRELVVNYLK